MSTNEHKSIHKYFKRKLMIIRGKFVVIRVKKNYTRNKKICIICVICGF